MADCSSGSECCAFCNQQSFMPDAGVAFNPDLMALLGGQQPIIPMFQSPADRVPPDFTMIPLAISLANVGFTGAASDSVAPLFTGF